MSGFVPAPPNCDGAGSPAPVQEDGVTVGGVVATVGGELAAALIVVWTVRPTLTGASPGLTLFSAGAGSRLLQFVPTCPVLSVWTRYRSPRPVVGSSVKPAPRAPPLASRLAPAKSTLIGLAVAAASEKRFCWGRLKREPPSAL